MHVETIDKLQSSNPIFHRETKASRAAFYAILLLKLHDAHQRVNERAFTQLKTVGESVSGTRTLFAARNGLKRIHRVNKWMRRFVGDYINSVDNLVRDN